MDLGEESDEESDETDEEDEMDSDELESEEGTVAMPIDAQVSWIDCRSDEEQEEAPDRNVLAAKPSKSMLKTPGGLQAPGKKSVSITPAITPEQKARFSLIIVRPIFNDKKIEGILSR